MADILWLPKMKKNLKTVNKIIDGESVVPVLSREL